MVREEQSRRLAERARVAGLISAEQLAEAIEAEPVVAGDKSLPDYLVERGFLTRTQWQALARELARDDFGRAPPPVALPPEVEKAAADPSHVLAEFVLVEKLGRGGAGVVWKAWDRDLSRYVAVKIPSLPDDSVELRERFTREATAAARLSHPNIVPVFRVGEAEGRPFLVMPFIDGATLDAAPPPLPRALEAMRGAALAVEHAHRHGVVHRDLKPGNIMLDREGRVFILDFGLVHLLEAEAARGVTAPGQALGTAAYMSPEQARGDARARDPATDVYALGATLYQLATGRAPFLGDSFAAIVSKVVNDEPLAPRRLRPDLPQDVETIILHAMDKDPARRYSSAADLAEDLRRMIEGEPIAARRLTLIGRSARHLRRWMWRGGPRPLLAACAVVALGGAVMAWRLHAARGEAAAAVREAGRVSLETALRLRRAGDLEGVRALLPRFAEVHARAVRQAPGLAEADYLMGRMYRAAMNDGQALAFQESALRNDPRLASARYERAILLSKKYGAALADLLEAALVINDPGVAARAARSLPPPKVEDLLMGEPELARARTTILADARHLQSAASSAVDVLAARGVLAFHEGRHLDAIDQLQQALARDPDREEAWEHLAMAAAALGRLAEAEDAFSRGMKRDRGYWPYHWRRCRLRIRTGDYAGALADAERAVEMDPRPVDGWLCRGIAHMFLAGAAMARGRDPRPELAAANADYDRAASIDPSVREIDLVRALAHRQLGIHHMHHGEDPLPDFARAEASLSAAIAARPAYATAWRARARTLFVRGLYEAAIGLDPEPTWASAQADFDEAIRLDRARVETWHYRGDLAAHRGAHRLQAGGDPEADFDAAEADLEEALRARVHPALQVSRGLLRTFRGHAAAARGEDPLPSWRLAEHDLDGALAAAPDHLDGLLRRGGLRLARAAFLRGHARATEAAGDERGAEGDLRRVLALSPDHAEALRELGFLHFLRGNRAEALVDLRRALAVNASLATDIARRLKLAAPRGDLARALGVETRTSRAADSSTAR